MKLAEKDRRDVVAIRRELRDRLRGVPGAEIDVSAVNDMGDSKSVSLAIVGPDRRAVEQAEPLVMEAIRKTDGAVDITSSRDKGKPELRLAVDRKQASDLGVSPMAVASLVRPLVDGVDVAKFEEPSTGEQYDVTLRLSDVDRSRGEQLETMTVTSTKKDQAGNYLQVKLSNVARFENTTSPAKLERRGLQPQIMVTSNKEGKTLNEVVGGREPEGGRAAPERRAPRGREGRAHRRRQAQQGDRRLHGHRHAAGRLLHLLRAGQPVRELQAPHHHHADPAPLHGGHGADAAGDGRLHEHDDEHRPDPAHGPGDQERHPAGGPRPSRTCGSTACPGRRLSSKRA